MTEQCLIGRDLKVQRARSYCLPFVSKVWCLHSGTCQIPSYAAALAIQSKSIKPVRTCDEKTSSKQVAHRTVACGRCSCGRRLQAGRGSRSEVNETSPLHVIGTHSSASDTAVCFQFLLSGCIVSSFTLFMKQQRGSIVITMAISFSNPPSSTQPRVQRSGRRRGSGCGPVVEQTMRPEKSGRTLR